MTIPAAITRWLRGPKADPSVRARYLTEIDRLPAHSAAVRAATRDIGRVGWVAEILADQMPDGRWGTPPPARPKDRAVNLYRPKYKSTNWVAIVLADLGATRRDPRVRKTAELILRWWGGPNGALYTNDPEICVTGNAVRTLVRFGYLDHRDVQRSIDWLVKAQKKDGGWHCFPSRIGTLDGWEPLAALASIPADRRTPEVQQAIDRGAEFYLERRLSREGTPRYRPWFRLHYPNHYYYDVLVGLSMLTRLGHARDARMGPALDWLESRRRPDGRWALDASHPDLDPETGGYVFRAVHYPLVIETPGRPSQWATIEALTVLRAAGRI